MHSSAADSRTGTGDGAMAATAVAVSVAVMGLDIMSRDRVIVDTGANEVVRPFNDSWWNEITVHKTKGK